MHMRDTYIMKPARPKITYLCPCWPVDKAYGGQLRALHIGRALKQIGHVRLVVVNADPASADAVERTSAEFEFAGEIKGAPQFSGGIRQRMSWALNPRHPNVHGFLANRAELEWLMPLAANADLVWFLKLRTANILNAWHWPRSVMDIDDVPSTYARTVRSTAKRLRERLVASAHIWITRRRERLLLERFGILSVCSSQDRQLLGFNDRIHVIPNGFQRPATIPLPRPATPPRIGFVGLFSYSPNHEGVHWFVRNCWPKIVNEIPGVRLRLIGSDTDGPLKPADSSVDGLGWVDDPAAEIASWSVMIVPIKTGAGTRIKIADAFSRKCPLVSTRLGAFGYDVQDGKQLRLADQPQDFAAACIDLIRDRTKAEAMAERAWNDFLEKWTWDAIAPKVWAAAEDCLRFSDKTNFDA